MMRRENIEFVFYTYMLIKNSALCCMLLACSCSLLAAPQPANSQYAIDISGAIREGTLVDSPHDVTWEKAVESLAVMPFEKTMLGDLRNILGSPSWYSGATVRYVFPASEIEGFTACPIGFMPAYCLSFSAEEGELISSISKWCCLVQAGEKISTGRTAYAEMWWRLSVGAGSRSRRSQWDKESTHFAKAASSGRGAGQMLPYFNGRAYDQHGRPCVGMVIVGKDDARWTEALKTAFGLPLFRTTAEEVKKLFGEPLGIEGKEGEGEFRYVYCYPEHQVSVEWRKAHGPRDPKGSYVWRDVELCLSFDVASRLIGVDIEKTYVSYERSQPVLLPRQGVRSGS